MVALRAAFCPDAAPGLAARYDLRTNPDSTPTTDLKRSTSSIEVVPGSATWWIQPSNGAGVGPWTSLTFEVRSP